MVYKNTIVVIALSESIVLFHWLSVGVQVHCFDIVGQTGGGDMYGVLARLAFALLIVVSASGCATRVALPVQSGIIVQVQHTYRAVQQPSAGGALVGGVVGGFLGSRVGKGSGKKAATIAGAVLGAAAGAGSGGAEMKPFSHVIIRDDISGVQYKTMVDGHWGVGMVIHYSVTQEGRFFLR